MEAAQVKGNDASFWKTDVWTNSVISYFTCSDLCSLQKCCKNFVTEEHWKTILTRDFTDSCGIVDCDAPLWTADTESFSSMRTFPTYQQAYKAWFQFQTRTNGSIACRDIRLSIDAWNRYKRVVAETDEDGKVLDRENQQNVLKDLQGAPPPFFFGRLRSVAFPSSHAAFLAVHGGEAIRDSSADMSAGLFGYVEVYAETRAMHLQPWHKYFHEMQSSQRAGMPCFSWSVGLSTVEIPSMPNMFELTLQVDFLQDTVKLILLEDEAVVVYEGGGLLEYFMEFVRRLEQGMYAVNVPGPGICLFPLMGVGTSCVVSHGIEIRVSVRWMPSFSTSANFAYQVSIRRVENTAVGCQLLDRDYIFYSPNGSTRRVTGAAVVGLQPMFTSDGISQTYKDLGPAGDGEIYDEPFQYASQSGDLGKEVFEAGSLAGLSGRISFVPGSIEDPKGPVFYCEVGRVAFTRPIPFY